MHGVRASEWSLSDAGRTATESFSRKADFGSASRIWSSAEPKAIETAQIVAAHRSLQVVIDADFGEHRRGSVSRSSSSEDFAAKVEMLLRNPDDTGFGDETGTEALLRFAAAIGRAIESGDDDIAVVTHGTVLSLFAEQDPDRRVALWKSLKFPDALRLCIEPGQHPRTFPQCQGSHEYRWMNPKRGPLARSQL